MGEVEEGHFLGDKGVEETGDELKLELLELVEVADGLAEDGFRGEVIEA